MAKNERNAVTQNGVVVSSVFDRPNMQFITVVRLDCTGKEVTVRFPDSKRKGEAVKVKV